MSEKNIDSYDRENLYKKAEEYIQSYIPEAVVMTHIRSISGEKPEVEVRFPLKGHKSDLEKLKRENHFLYVRGINLGGSRCGRGYVVFNEDGTLD